MTWVKSSHQKFANRVVSWLESLQSCYEVIVIDYIEQAIGPTSALDISAKPWLPFGPAGRLRIAMNPSAVGWTNQPYWRRFQCGRPIPRQSFVDNLSSVLKSRAAPNRIGVDARVRTRYQNARNCVDVQVEGRPNACKVSGESGLILESRVYKHETLVGAFEFHLFFSAKQQQVAFVACDA